jgi:hypothetical protein
MNILAQAAPFAGEWASFGAAGLMGALWIWERRLSRSREAQLTQTHDRLMAERGQMRLLVNLVRRNTAAMSRLQTTQDQLTRLLSNWQAEDPATPRSQDVA